MVGPSKSRPPMSHRKTDLGIPCRSKSAKVVLGRVLGKDHTQASDGSTSAQIWPKRVGSQSQRFIQMGIVENVPQQVYCFAIGPRMIAKHTLDRSECKRDKRVAAALQRGLDGRGAHEFAQAQNCCSIRKVVRRR